MAKCSCPVETLTTYHHDYLAIQTPVPVVPAIKPRPPDQELISGHNENNLQINGKLIKSKVWPNMLQQAEEYDHFLKRLERCKRGIYEMYFKNPPADKLVIANMFKNLSKTSYQLLFSPDDFAPRKETRRFAISDHHIDIKYQETTYGTFYDCIKELERFRDALYGVVLKDSRPQLNRELRAIYRCGRSTYNDTVSRPATVFAKPTLPGPIDRYTLRRI